MNAIRLRMFRPCLLFILCSQIDFNSVLNNNNSFLRYKMSFFTIEQSMRESMATKPIYIYIYIYIYTDVPDINMLTNVCFFWLFVFY